MIELACPVCDAGLLVAFDAPELGCRDCGIAVEIDVVTFPLAAAA